MTVSVIIPVGGDDDEWRSRARNWIVTRYATNYPDWELIEGRCGHPWSKGSALADGVNRATGDILVLADADSYVPIDTLRQAARIVATDPLSWVVPHGNVFRLKQEETVRVYSGQEARLGHTVRPHYRGPAGGGITILSRQAWHTVGGVDPRYLGWGGEDLSFGWALNVLVGRHHRLGADFVHLWHPHPAPDLRGSPESEELVARYKDAWKYWKRTKDQEPMRLMVEEVQHATCRSS
jgi:hypothetical protein